MNESDIRQLINQQVRSLLKEGSHGEVVLKDVVLYNGDYWPNSYLLVVECSSLDAIRNLSKVVEYVDDITSKGASRTFIVSVDDPTDEKEKEVCEFYLDGDGADRVLSINKVRIKNPNKKSEE